MTTTIPEQLPPLVELTQEQEITRILEQLVQEKGQEYCYPHAAITDDDGHAISIGTCMYLETLEGSTKVHERYVEEHGWIRQRTLPVEKLQPSCIIGHLLVRLGVPMEILRQYNEDAFVALVANTHHPVIDQISGNQKLHQSLANLQGNQDGGMPWSKAVTQFKEEVAA